mgnify:FL=1
MEINSSNSPKRQIKGYANFKRAELFEKLKTSLGKVKNKKTGIEAVLSKKSLEKMTSAKAIEKSKQNGYSLDEHFEMAEKIIELFECAELIASHPDLKNPDDPNIISIKRFASAAELSNRAKSEVLITVKESIANGHHIYSIELFKINKASEKFRGLSDAAKNGEQGN